MGFNIKTSELLIHSKKLGVDFTSVATIGRQRLHGSYFLFKNLFKKFDFSGESFEKIITQNNRYAEGFLALLGAKKVDSVDASSYEAATIIHDMNQPIPEDFKDSYSVVIDSGSLEHIFNFPIAIKNCMEMVKPGGHFIGITPTNNFLGHGFYQFSPELFYRIFNAENGFKMKKMYLFFADHKSPVYDVSDPLEVKERVKLKNSKESFLFYVAQKIENKDIFSVTPQQSDYQYILWEEGNSKKVSKKQGQFFFIKKLIPGFLVIIIVRLRESLLHLISIFSPIGNGNKRHFKKVKLD